MSYFKAKMHQIRFLLGHYPRPRWGSLQRSPDLIAGFQGLLLRGGGQGRKREGREGSTIWEKPPLRHQMVGYGPVWMFAPIVHRLSTGILRGRLSSEIEGTFPTCLDYNGHGIMNLAGVTD